MTSLLAFNVGVELGQLLVLALLVPALQLLFRYVVAERMGTIILSALVAHTAWHWTAERWEQLRQFELAGARACPRWRRAVRWLMAAVGAPAVAVADRRRRPEEAPRPCGRLPAEPGVRAGATSKPRIAQLGR